MGEAEVRECQEAVLKDGVEMVDNRQSREEELLVEKGGSRGDLGSWP